MWVYHDLDRYLGGGGKRKKCVFVQSSCREDNERECGDDDDFDSEVNLTVIY